jgi:diguanylate cyclase (GGDEF)-like protein
MLNKTKPYIAVSIAIWSLIIAASGIWNVLQARNSQHQIYLESGRAFFNLIVLTREWNSQHGGVYVPITADIQPNPFLDVPNRDITTTSDQKFTLINPAYMTRLISELAAKKDNVQFHITSLKPIRPANAPIAWEAVALTGFEGKGQAEYYEYAESQKISIFRYMAPLITQQSCLKCHAKQGYEVGDVRGGISVSFPVQFTWPWALIFSHLVIGLGGGGLIYIFGKKLERSMQILENLSRMDGLTQIHNRRFFDEALTREYLYSRRNKIPLSIAICDIDNFKAFNDSYGHQAGDECLKWVAQALDSVLKRPGDLVARYGGEEFGIILPYSNADAALAVGNMLRGVIESLQIPHNASTTSNCVTVSIGVASYQSEDVSRDDLVRIADQALYKAKASGRNFVSIAQAKDCPR